MRARRPHVMFRKTALLFALLAWCCLVVPWQSCTSGCRQGALQPFWHGCHKDSGGDAGCGCSHDHRDPVAAGTSAEATTRDPVVNRSEQPGAAHRCAGVDHVSIVFQQTAPERSATDPGAAGDQPVAQEHQAPGIPAWFCARRSRGLRLRQHPPDFELQRLLQLRVTRLLV